MKHTHKFGNGKSSFSRLSYAVQHNPHHEIIEGIISFHPEQILRTTIASGFSTLNSQYKQNKKSKLICGREFIRDAPLKQVGEEQDKQIHCW